MDRYLSAYHEKRIAMHNDCGTLINANSEEIRVSGYHRIQISLATPRIYVLVNG